MDAVTLPGMSRTTGDPDTIVCFKQPTPTNLVERPVVLLATAPINKGSIFSNGLYQNIYVFYKLLEAIGYLPFFLQNVEPGAIDEILQGHRTIGVETLMQKPFPIHAYIEIGMSVDPNFRHFMRLLGARNVKIYLGNILNIDVETSQLYPHVFFNHHVVGEMDEIWVSPHYEQHREYAAVLNKVYEPANAKIVPYVWDPCFITRFGTTHLKWQPAAAGTRETIILMEPNISFQKCSLIPLLALNKYKRENPAWDAQIIVVNGHRLAINPHFNENVRGNLVIQPVYRDRASIIDLLRDYPSATFICNQVNNEYNYMIMELLFCGFPVIHNGETWASYGYSYKGNSIRSLLAAFKEARSSHATGVVQKISQAQTLFWRYSIHNPVVQAAWRGLVGWTKPTT